MTRPEAIAKLNNAGISVAANARDWAMGQTIMVGVSPTKVMGVISYKHLLYLREEDVPRPAPGPEARWGFEPVMFAGGESPVLWFPNLEAAVYGLISFLKVWNA